ncbi:ribonuclease-like [Chelonia mydas]|uniref:Angiogenin n=1 Tax=Chelonia mydas TaxID=8469 RepID=M7AT13_CHEMY|nr:ribonuclease-like [Chelonia mydas]EMP28511.1 Angiogenin [Chelonia mydas]
MCLSWDGLNLLLFLVLAWCLAPPAHCQGPRYEKFLRQHHDHPRTNAGRDYCGAMMQRRGMARPCKNINTFIHAPKAQIQAVCSSGGIEYWGMRRSRAQFPVTTCSLKGPPWGRCSYLGHANHRFLVITCDPAGWPMHFDESHIM